MTAENAPAPTSRPTRVVVADDHPAIRAGLVALLGSAADLEVVAEAADGPSAVDAAERTHPDVVLTDVRMPGATGIDITPALRATGARVLVISAFDLDAAVLAALAAGADGYLVKTEPPARILAAVRAVASGDAVLSAAATRAVVGALQQAPADSHDGAPTTGTGSADAAGSGDGLVVPLTEREEDVLRLIAEGRSNLEIARALFVEVTTVKTHVTNLLAKLQVSSRVQAALWWQRHRGA